MIWNWVGETGEILREGARIVCVLLLYSSSTVEGREGSDLRGIVKKGRGGGGDGGYLTGIRYVE